MWKEVTIKNLLLLKLKIFKSSWRLKKGKRRKFKIIRDINFSSSNLINSNFDKLNLDQKKIFQNIIIKNQFDFEKITTNKIKKPILVFGDIIFDKFVFTQSLGKSRKNNIISTRFKKNRIIWRWIINDSKNSRWIFCQRFNFNSFKLVGNN